MVAPPASGCHRVRPELSLSGRIVPDADSSPAGALDSTPGWYRSSARGSCAASSCIGRAQTAEREFPPCRTTTAFTVGADPSAADVCPIEGIVAGPGSARRFAPEQDGAAGRPGPSWPLRGTIPASPGVVLLACTSCTRLATNSARQLHHDPSLHLASPFFAIRPALPWSAGYPSFGRSDTA